MKTKFNKFNENNKYGIRIFNFVDAHDFARYIEEKFGIDSGDVYDKLLDDDYVEGSLGSRWELDDYTMQESDKGNEIAKWYLSFLFDFNLDSIQLKYGG
jgi:hypothetical protein